MTEILYRNQTHIHVFTQNVSQGEYANAIYTDKTQAAIDFAAMANNYRHGTWPMIAAEEALDSLKDGMGMHAGNAELIFTILRCPGGCRSPQWN